MSFQACLCVSTRRLGRAAKAAFVASVFSLGAVVFLFASLTQGNTVQFTFPDLSPFDAGTNTNPISTYTQVETKAGVTLMTVDIRAPKYVVNPENSNQLLWDGVTYVTSADSPPVRTNINGGNGLGIDNSSISSTHIPSESQNIHPDESWTFKFDQAVVFTQVEFVSLGSSDEATVTIDLDGVNPFVFSGGPQARNNPFGGLLIPADTSITFTNTAESITSISFPPALPDTSIWRIMSLTVEIQVPVPGDYNGDGTVDAADYVLWRDALGGPADSLLNRNPENEGAIEQADYEFWKANFGNPSNEGFGSAAAVPEPATSVLAGIAFVALAMIGLRKRRSCFGGCSW